MGSGLEISTSLGRDEDLLAKVSDREVVFG